MNTYTYQDWVRDGSFAARTGQPVDETIVRQMADSVPPLTYNHSFLQVGEPADLDWNTFEDLYDTFERQGGQWVYLGCQPAGKTRRNNS